MANQFTIKPTVTFINELHLHPKFLDYLQTFGEIPTLDSVVDKNIAENCDILIFRASKEFKKAFPNAKKCPVVVLKSLY